MRAAWSLMAFAAVAWQCQGKVESPLEFKRGKHDRSLDNETRLWLDMHAAYVEDVQEAVGQGYEILLYGDSNIEALRGTALGAKLSRARDTKRAWLKLVAPYHRAKVLGIGGNTAGDLLWRLQNGEGPGEVQPPVVGVLIGTNDLLQADSSLIGNDTKPILSQIFLRIRAVMDEVLEQAPNSTLVALGLLPLNPMDSNKYVAARAGSSFQQAVDAINARLQKYSSYRQRQGLSIHYHDCNRNFLGDGSAQDEQQQQQHLAALIPDGIHPAGAGAWKFVACLENALRWPLDRRRRQQQRQQQRQEQRQKQQQER